MKQDKQIVFDEQRELKEMRLNLYNYLNVIGFVVLTSHLFTMTQLITLTWLYGSDLHVVLRIMITVINTIFALMNTTLMFIMVRNYLKERRIHRDMLTGKNTKPIQKSES